MLISTIFIPAYFWHLSDYPLPSVVILKNLLTISRFKRSISRNLNNTLSKYCKFTYKALAVVDLMCNIALEYKINQLFTKSPNISLWEKKKRMGNSCVLIQEYRDKCKMDLNPSNFAVHKKKEKTRLSKLSGQIQIFSRLMRNKFHKILIDLHI